MFRFVALAGLFCPFCSYNISLQPRVLLGANETSGEPDERLGSNLQRTKFPIQCN